MEVKCIHCTYEWEYGGSLAKATCPNCERKTPAKNSHPEDRSEDTGNVSEKELTDTERIIRAYTDPVVTASDVAEVLECSPRHALAILRQLEREGAVQSKQTGAGGIAWWHIERVRAPQPEREQIERQTAFTVETREFSRE